MQLDDVDSTCKYLEYLDDSNQSYWGESLPCWVKYNSKTNILSIKFEYEQEENEPTTYVWFSGTVNTFTNPYTVELVSNKPDVTKETIWLEIMNDDEDWYFEGLITDPYTENIEGILINKVEKRTIFINQV